MSEVRPEKIHAFHGAFDCWVQTACPRLSIDWNYTFADNVPLLTPYELNVLLGHAPEFSLEITRPSKNATDPIGKICRPSDSQSTTTSCSCATRESVDFGTIEAEKSCKNPAACPCGSNDGEEINKSNGLVPYPMDFYATADTATHAGPWTPGFHLRPRKQSLR
jgi:hypothetical protein